ncbi:MAG: 4-hydroxy-tetrahydrodipicolinate synthase [Bacteroidales bacterium]|nr:4-hydroxy-tetrahydrodipicolinate synthase [Bacteroidales bacterium]
MKTPNPFTGLGVALVTPFTPEGAVDYTALSRLIDEQISGGIDFLCVLGTTAETPCLTAEEKHAITRFAVEAVGGRVPILLGAGGNNTAAVIDAIRHADLGGIDGLLIVTPYYNKPSAEGLYQHFKAVAESTTLPIVLYNVPGRTGVNLTADTALRLARNVDNIVAIKEASGNLAQIETIISGAPEGFDVLSGDDAITLELIGIGARGVISVVGNAYPAEFGRMVHAALEGQHDEALSLHRSFRELYHFMSVDGNPSGIKTFLACRGDIACRLRLPLVPATDATITQMKDWLEKGF